MSIFALLMTISMSAQNPLIESVLREKIRTGNHKTTKVLNSLEKSAVGDDTKISDNTELDEGEPYIAINPTDSLNIVVSFMAFTADSELDFPIYTSFDGGESWALSSYNARSVLTPGGLNLGGGDPLLAFDNSGRLYFGHLYLAAADFSDFLSPTFTIYWAYSDDGGMNFQIPDDNIMAQAKVGLFDGLITDGDGVFDRPWYAIDRSGGNCEGNLYVSGLFIGSDTTSLPSGMVVKRKIAGQDTFVPTHTKVSIDTLVQFGNIQSDNQGTLHVTYGNLNTDKLMYARSTDCGETFSTPVSIGAFVWDEAATTYDITDRDNPAMSLGVEPITGNVHAVWSSFENGVSKSYYVRSTDAGTTWEAPKEFSELISNVDVQAYFPNLAVSPNGRVSISWYDLDANDSGHYVIAESLDGGVTFDDFTQLSSSVTPFADYECTSSPLGDTCPFFGDYFGSARTDCRSYSVWSDGRDGQGPKIYMGITNHCGMVTGTTDFYPITDKIALQSLYPNPARDEFYVEIALEQSTELNIRLQDTQGRPVKNIMAQSLTDGEHRISLNVNDLPSGVYILTIESTFGTINKHFVKN